MLQKTFRNGQAIVEMALVFPLVLLVIVGGIIDFGFTFNNIITLQQVANDSAQFAAEGKVNGQPPSTTDVENLVKARKPTWWAGQIQTLITTSTTADAGGATVKVVTLTYVSPVYTPFYQTMVKGVSGIPGLTITARAAYQVPQR